MRKNTIRLNESHLRQIVKESVKNIINNNEGGQDNIWVLVKRIIQKNLSENFYIQDDGDTMYIEDYDTKQGINITMGYSASDFHDRF